MSILCRPMWPFLLMYRSHDMRHTGFPQVDGGQQDSRKFGASQYKLLVHSLNGISHTIGKIVAQDFNRSVLTTRNDLVSTSCASTLVCIERDQLRVIILY